MKHIITILAILASGLAFAGQNSPPKFKIYKKPNINCNGSSCDIYGYTFTIMSADERTIHVKQIVVNGKCNRLGFEMDMDMGRSIDVWDGGSPCGNVMKITIQTDKGTATYVVR